MEQHTFWMTGKTRLTDKLGQQKGAMATCFIIILLTFIVCMVVAFFLNESLFLLVEGLLFLAAGTVHVWMLNKELPGFSHTQRWLFTFSLAGTVVLLFALFFLLQSRFSWLFMVSGPSAFLLPFTALEIYRLYNQVAEAGMTTWYPVSEFSATYPAIYVNGIPVCFKIIMGENREDRFSIDFLPSVRLKPGEILVDIAQKQKRQGGYDIPLLDENGEPYRWVFFTPDQVLWKRALDPALTLSQNRIKYGNVIYAVRVEENDALQETGEPE